MTDLLSLAQLRSVARVCPRAAARLLREFSQPELERVFERWVREGQQSRDALADELQQVMEQGDDL